MGEGNFFSEEKWDELGLKVLNAIKEGKFIVNSDTTTDYLIKLLNLSVEYEFYEISKVIHDELKKRT
jgi:hypothetical protein